MNSSATAGPWEACLTVDGQVTTLEHVDLKRWVSISVVRRAARPDTSGRQRFIAPGSNDFDLDVLYAIRDIDLPPGGNDKEAIAARWEQAQAVAAALNTRISDLGETCTAVIPT